MADLDEISLSIGRLQANVDNLARQVGPLSGLPADVTSIKASVEAMQPVVEKVKRWEQRIVGVSAVVSAIITVIGSGFVGKIREWFS